MSGRTSKVALRSRAALAATRTAKVASSITQESIKVEAGSLVEGIVKRPKLRGPEPSRKNGENELLIEHVYWTRLTTTRWLPLGS